MRAQVGGSRAQSMDGKHECKLIGEPKHEGSVSVLQADAITDGQTLQLPPPPQMMVDAYCKLVCRAASGNLQSPSMQCSKHINHTYMRQITHDSSNRLTLRLMLSLPGNLREYYCGYLPPSSIHLISPMPSRHRAISAQTKHSQRRKFQRQAVDREAVGDTSSSDSLEMRSNFPEMGNILAVDYASQGCDGTPRSELPLRNL
ncbi:hypothetical protein CC78DRAFT_573180 [Lojkania enalia]|uniref:Uncharacterized protein n=1 Tax=Lojkania enalia TaxID=147567 RepID=A0A9P4NCQ3_9PLEO|nr:hypothetical protein CC78DRAFT_573180 [Didymosphaeria enalia]